MTASNTASDDVTN